jgi:fructose-1-phosphate kinase PfkB-like protein
MSIVPLTMNPAIDKSADVDRVVPDRKLRCRPPHFEPGGGGINVARALKRLGENALAVYPAGGPPAELLARLLEGEKLAHRAIVIQGWTQFDFVESRQRRRGQTKGRGNRKRTERLIFVGLRDFRFVSKVNDAPRYIV